MQLKKQKIKKCNYLFLSKLGVIFLELLNNITYLPNFYFYYRINY